MNSDSIEDLATWDVLVGNVVGDWDRANLKVKPFSDAPGRFAAGARFCVEQNGRRRLLHVHSSRAIGHTFILDVGLNSSQEAQSFKGAELLIHRSMRPPLPEGEFYVTDVLGMKVVTENGDELGEVEEILETPAHDVYVTASAMIPAHDEFIVRRDWDNQTLVVRDVPGLRTDEPTESRA
jgi:16S rRNA processing protein RimM